MARLKFFLLILLGIGVRQGRAQCQTAVTNGDGLRDDEFVAQLTDPCRYDKNVRPNTSTPFDVRVRIDVTHLEAALSQFTAYMTARFIYQDNTLDYTQFSPRRSIILGDESLKEKIWTPNIFLKDQNETTVIGTDFKDVLVSIDQTGQVTYSQKFVSKFDCWMNLKKFPFDHQKCNLEFSDWTYSSANLKLSWDSNPSPIFAQNLHFTEYIIDEVIFSTQTNKGPYVYDELASEVGNFSALTIQFKFHRDIGYYMLDFFVPSYLLVFTAWVTFWLQADAGPPRATLGSSTVVAFITLHLGVSKDMPKVSYIKASDIWFLGIITFIFLSLAEFAFVNVIWRRKKEVQLKKDHPKYIFKSALMPRKAREDLKRYESNQSLSVISQGSSDRYSDICKNMDLQENLTNGHNLTNCHSTISMPEDLTQHFSWTTMTPQEVAIYVDRKARIVFPVCFLIFNILYWVFVYCL